MLRLPTKSTADTERNRATPLSVLALCLIAFGLAARFGNAAPAEQPVPEYSVKAGYLLLFARYVQWPAQAFVSADAPLIVAIIGRDPFGSVLDETLRDQRIGERRVRLIRVATPSPDLQAHLVFIASTQARDELRWLEYFRDRAVLTVVESDEGLDAGAIVRLAQEHDKVRFDIDWLAATRVNLKIASPMLVSARHVRGAPTDVHNGAKP